MKEILFRGQRIDNEEWVEGSYSTWKDEARLSSVILKTGKGFSENDMIKWYVDYSTVGQYTGLKDKNGKKIFEGDIVICDWHWTTPTEIEWPDSMHDFMEFSLEDNATILGNIHDNPELLEKQSDS